MKLKLKPELIETIEKNISEGNYVNIVCQAVGIHKASYYSWYHKGENGRGIFKEFHDAIDRATAKAEQTYIGVIRDAANKGTWYAAAWWLERRFPERWGKREQVDVTSGGKPLQTIDLTKLSDVELETIEKVISGTGATPQLERNSGGEGET
jgi:hypothetical protein